jgi:hypothetical protein
VFVAEFSYLGFAEDPFPDFVFFRVAHHGLLSHPCTCLKYVGNGVGDLIISGSSVLFEVQIATTRKKMISEKETLVKEKE